MTPKLPSRWCPIWAMAVRKGRECARLTAVVRRLELDNVVLTAHLNLARDQRDRARDIACAIEGGDEMSNGAFTAYDFTVLGWGE